MATEEIEISELEFTEELASDNLIPVESATDTKATSLQILKNWLSSFFVRKTGNEDVGGIKNFLDTINFKKNIIGLIEALSGELPTTAKGWNISVRNKDNKTLGSFESYVESDGRTQVILVARSYDTSGNVKATVPIRVVAKQDGTGFVQGVTPPSSDNSTQFATTAWVRNEGAVVVEKGTNFVKYSNGLIIQWGVNEVLASSTTITLHRPFTTTNYTVTHTAQDNVGTYCVGLLVESKTTTSFVVHGWDRAGTAKTTNNWLAIGF